MAKTEKPVSDELATLEPASNLLKFRDLVYTSRTLIIPKSARTLPVAKGLVEVQPDDAEALAFLNGNEEFAPLKE